MKFRFALLLLITFNLIEKSIAADNEEGTDKEATDKEATDKDANCECGIANEREKRQSHRIVGGSEANKNKYPWLVSVVMSFNGMKSQCGGSIINTRYILTAGHCTYAGLCTKPFKAKDIVVTVAEHNIYSFNDDVRGVTEKITAQEIIRHPEYCTDRRSPTAYNNDIALLLLPKDLDLSHKELGIICLPDNAWSSYEGKKVSVAGWGLNQAAGAAAGTSADNLLEVDFTVMNDCRKYKFGYHLTNNMMCAGDTEKVKDACGGDSGGPLMHKNEKNRYVQVGIVSFGPPGGNCTGLGVYTQVAHYIDWIKEIAYDGQCKI